MAYPQPDGMYQRPSWGGGQYNWGGGDRSGWGGYASQTQAGGASPQASWYHGGDYSQNPAYRTQQGYYFPRHLPAATVAPADATVAPADVPAAAVPGTPTYNGTPSAQPLTPGGTPWSSDYVDPNLMNLANPLAQALSHVETSTHTPPPSAPQGTGTSAGAMMIPGFGPGNLPPGVFYDSNGGNFYDFMNANPNIPVYTSQGDGQYVQTSGTPTPLDPNLMFSPQQLAAFNPINPNAAPTTSATQWYNQNAA